MSKKLLYVPTILCVFGLTADFLGIADPDLLLPYFIPLSIASFFGVYLASQKTQWSSKDLRPFDVALLAQCSLTPLGLLAAWTVAPGLFSYGGAKYFIDWLTKHPNFGPLNGEVLLGTICIIGASLSPVIFSKVSLRDAGSSGRDSRAALVVHLVFYLPVVWCLDLDTLRSSVMLIEVPRHPALAVSVGPASIFAFLELTGQANGAVFRLAAFMSMWFFVFRTRARGQQLKHR